MSGAKERLERNRQAVLAQVARRQRKHDPREEPPQGYEAGFGPDFDYAGMEPPAGGWFDHVLHGVRTWWRYHPAHMAVELATPLLRSYAQRKPMQMLGISLAVGAALTFARPWRLISLTTLLVAVLKSSQLSQVFMAAMSAADYRKDHNRPE
jgi:hypothetical protein